MPLANMGDYTPSWENDPTTQKYRAIIRQARNSIITSYIAGLIDYWFDYRVQMPLNQQRAFLVQEITRVQKDLKDKIPKIVTITYLAKDLWYDLKKWNYPELNLIDNLVSGSAKFKEDLERNAVNPVQAKMIWEETWLKLERRGAKEQSSGQSTPHEMARQKNRLLRANTACYVEGKLTMEQLIQHFYNVKRSIDPKHYLDPVFLRLLGDTSGLDETSRGAFSMAYYQATQRLAQERLDG